MFVSEYLKQNQHPEVLLHFYFFIIEKWCEIQELSDLPFSVTKKESFANIAYPVSMK